MNHFLVSGNVKQYIKKATPEASNLPREMLIKLEASILGSGSISAKTPSTMATTK